MGIRVTFDQFRALQPSKLFGGGPGKAIRQEVDRLAGLVGEVIGSDEDVEVCFSLDLSATVNRLNPAESGQYSADKGSAGSAAARTLSVRGRPVVAVELGHLISVDSVLDGGMFSVNPAGVELMTHTLVHEAHHVLMHLRRTSASDAGIEIPLGLQTFFPATATLAVDEFRAERGARSHPVSDRSLDEDVELLARELAAATHAFDRDRDLEKLALTVCRSASSFWITGLAYGAGRGGPVPKSALWDRYVSSGHWLALAEELERLPPSDVAGDAQVLSAIVDCHQAVTAIMEDLMSQHGFLLRRDPESAQMAFWRTREDFPS